MIVTRLLRCPECGQIRQFHGERSQEWPLQCVHCDHRWTAEVALNAFEVVAQIGKLLAENCDESRRRFYNSTALLDAIAELIDAAPTAVPPCTDRGVLLVGRPGDEVAPCPWCGEPVAFNDGVQRVSHELPVCETFHTEMGKQPNYMAAVEMLKSRTVSA